MRPGYKVVYEDGYTSWSPKETFERAYRLVAPPPSQDVTLTGVSGLINGYHVRFVTAAAARKPEDPA